MGCVQKYYKKKWLHLFLDNSKFRGYEMSTNVKYILDKYIFFSSLLFLKITTFIPRRFQIQKLRNVVYFQDDSSRKSSIYLYWDKLKLFIYFYISSITFFFCVIMICKNVSKKLQHLFPKMASKSRLVWVEDLNIQKILLKFVDNFYLFFICIYFMK